jgi:putative transcriptional regulator
MEFWLAVQDICKGKAKPAREHIIHVPDVRAIRESLGLSQAAFASAYLNVIAKMPDEARDVLKAA